MHTKLTNLIILLIPLLSSCAVNYQDKDGNQRIIGFVSITLEKSPNQYLVAGDKIDITNIGVMYSSTPIHNGLSIGYYNEIVTILKNDVATIISE